jgi:hypothetical protein
VRQPRYVAIDSVTDMGPRQEAAGADVVEAQEYSHQDTEGRTQAPGHTIMVTQPSCRRELP